MSVVYYPDKDVVFAEALIQMSMGNVAHISDDKNELVNKVHGFPQLGVRLEDSSNRGSILHHNSGSL